MSASLHTQTAEQAAAYWFGLKRSGAMTLEETRTFEHWLALEPEHRAAHDNLEQYWIVAEAVRNDPQVLTMRDAAAHAHKPIGRIVAVGCAFAAGAALAVALGLHAFKREPLIALPSLAPSAPTAQQQVFRTSVGQTTSVLLPDGSTVTLDTDTVLRVRLDAHERRLDLEKGRAFFRVAKDKARPFIVAAAGRTITATGTAFEVRAESSKFEVVLVEGRVRVQNPVFRSDVPPQITEMTAGSQFVADEKRWTVAETDVAKKTSWLSGRLTFDHEPLSEVIAEMNRYSDRKIVLSDPAIGQEPILGVFKAGDVEAFVRALEEYDLARVSTKTDAEIVLAPL